MVREPTGIVSPDLESAIPPDRGAAGPGDVVAHFLADPPFWIAAVLFLVPFVAARIWLFTDYPLPGIRADSDSYFQVVRAIDAGRLPDFSMRSPGYPLLMKLVYSFSDSIMAVVWVQVLLSAASGLYMLYAIFRFHRWLAPWAAIGLAAYFVGNLSLEHDTDLLPEALYADCILAWFASLIMAFSTRRAVFFGLSSVAVSAAILTKPAGLFLIVVYVAVISFMLLNRYGARRLAAFALPLPFVLLLLSVYNFVAAGVFTPTAFGESQIAFTTFTFWEQDASYPADVNAAIAAAQQKMSTILTEKDQELLHAPFSLERRQKLSDIFLKGFSYPTLDAATRMGQGNYLLARDWIRTISLDSIKKHPDTYAKFVETQLASWYLDNITFQPDFVDSLENRAVQYYVERRFSATKGNPGRTALAKEFADPREISGVQILGTGDDARVKLTSTSLPRRLYEVVYATRNMIFSSPFWSLAAFPLLLIAVWRLAASRWRDAGAFLIAAMLASVIAASLVVALVEIALVRYSYSTEWAYYLSMAMAPSLLFAGAPSRGRSRRGQLLRSRTLDEVTT